LESSRGAVPVWNESKQSFIYEPALIDEPYDNFSPLFPFWENLFQIRKLPLSIMNCEGYGFIHET
jgi:hypothetical protein